MGWFDPQGRAMLTLAIPKTEANDFAGSVLAVSLVDTQGDPVDLSSVGSGGAQYQLVSFPADVLPGQCVRITDGFARIVRSTDAIAPWVDGVSCSAYKAGTTGVVATSPLTGFVTSTLPDARILFLGQDGLLTATSPTRASGDLWSVTVAHKTGPTNFIFNPQPPIGLI